MKLLLAALLLTGCAQGKANPKDYTHRIEGLTGGVCSATAVGQRTLLTANHCLKPGQNVLIVDGTLVGIMHIERDGKDHALVVVTITFPHVAKMAAAPAQGDKVRWYGQPMGLKQVYGEGLIVGEYQDRQLIDGTIWLGCSGAGLLNERGEVVGVISGILGQEIFKLGWSLPLSFSAKQWKEVR